MKRILALVIAALMLLSLVSCASQKDEFDFSNGSITAAPQDQSNNGGMQQENSGSAQDQNNNIGGGNVNSEPAGDQTPDNGAQDPVINEQPNNTQQPENNQQNNQQPSDENNQQGGNDQQPTDQPSQGENEQPEESEDDDPYAAMKADQSGTKVKIMCQNLRCDATADKGTDNDARIRRFRFQALVEKYDPDIIAAQECDATWIDFLQTDYGAKYGMFYKYREGGNNESCPVLWKLDKYEKLGEGYFWLSKTPNQSGPSYEEGELPRIVNWVYLKDKSTGSKFYILSTHFGFYEEESSIIGLREQILGQFKKASNDSYAFCLGDFNFYYQGDQYYTFADGVNMIDLRVIAEEMAANGHCTLGEFRKGSHNGFKYEDGNAFIDYVMVAPRKRLAVDTYGILYEKLGDEANGVGESWISDHFAVYTEVRIDTDISYVDYYGNNAK